MQKWQKIQKQKAHNFIVFNSKSKLKTHSHGKCKDLNSNQKKSVQSIPLYNQNISFIRILEMYQLQKYSSLLLQYQFPYKLSTSNPSQYINKLLIHVEQSDQQSFLSMMNTLIMLSKQIKKSMIYHTPVKNKRSMRNIASFTPKTIKDSSNVTLNANKKFRIKNKPKYFTHHQSPGQRKTVKRYPPKLPQNTNHQTKNTISPALDDLHITHNYQKSVKGKPMLLHKSNSIIQRLNQKLVRQFNDPNQSKQYNLQLDKIKHMYISYDSATLSSNIGNIDIQQIIDCLAIQIKNLIHQQTVQKNQFENTERIKQLLQQSFMMVKQQSKQSITSYEDNTVIDNNINDVVDTISSDSLDPQSDRDDNSIVISLDCFNYTYHSTMGDVIPSKEDIKNWIQLIMMAGKMEKQMPILAYVYIRKIMNKTRTKKLTYKNWKNILFITLIEASKIWDDQSFENHSFSKVLEPYNTLQINRLEKNLLFLIDYLLNIDQKQYCESYFKLRQHVSKAEKTANLIQLDLKTIQKLSLTGVKQKESKLRSFYKNRNEKSF